MIMEIYLNNTLTEPSLVTYNDGLNFGRFFSHNIVLDYKIIMSKTNFFKLLEKPYHVALEEIKADDIKYNETSDFSELNYCSLEELLPNSEGLTTIVDVYLRNELFQDILKPHTFKYVINTLESIQLVEDQLLIEGKCFERVRR